MICATRKNSCELCERTWCSSFVPIMILSEMWMLKKSVYFLIISANLIVALVKVWQSSPGRIEAWSKCMSAIAVAIVLRCIQLWRNSRTASTWSISSQNRSQLLYCYEWIRIRCMKATSLKRDSKSIAISCSPSLSKPIWRSWTHFAALSVTSKKVLQRFKGSGGVRLLQSIKMWNKLWSNQWKDHYKSCRERSTETLRPIHKHYLLWTFF